MAEVWTPPAFDDITTSELVTAAYLNGLGNSLRFLKEVNSTTFTSAVSVTGTTFVDVVSSGAITYEAVPHLFEFRTTRITVGGSGNLEVALRDGATDVGWFTLIALSETERGFYSQTALTPTAASHTYKVSCRNTVAQTSTVEGGAGGAGVVLPGHLRITRIPT